jgi:hypothetical protein
MNIQSKEDDVLIPHRFTLTLISVLFLLTSTAAAQGRIDAYFAMGTAHAGSTGEVADYLGNGVALVTPSMGGVFGTLGGGVMLTPSLGVGGEVSFRFAQGDYAGLGYRPVFYDFNGIWTPKLGTERVMPEFQAGLGGMSMRFYGGTPYYNYYTGRYSNFLGSSNHFQLHTGVGLRVYVTERVFVRPQFDYHWVRNLEEFKSNSVPAFSVAIGISWR